MNDKLQPPQQDTGPVECLGQTFPNDQARRVHSLKLLAEEKLQDPEFNSYLSTNYKDLRGPEKNDPRMIAKTRELVRSRPKHDAGS